MARLRIVELARQLLKTDQPDASQLSRFLQLPIATVYRLWNDTADDHRPRGGPSLGTLEVFAEACHVHVATVLIAPSALPRVVREVIGIEQRPSERQALIRQLRALADELEQEGSGEQRSNANA